MWGTRPGPGGRLPPLLLPGFCRGTPHPREEPHELQLRRELQYRALGCPQPSPVLPKAARSSNHASQSFAWSRGVCFPKAAPSWSSNGIWGSRVTQKAGREPLGAANTRRCPCVLSTRAALRLSQGLCQHQSVHSQPISCVTDRLRGQVAQHRWPVSMAQPALADGLRRMPDTRLPAAAWMPIRRARPGARAMSQPALWGVFLATEMTLQRLFHA